MEQQPTGLRQVAQFLPVRKMLQIQGFQRSQFPNAEKVTLKLLSHVRQD
jgi:hypothetical protein